MCAHLAWSFEAPDPAAPGPSPGDKTWLVLGFPPRNPKRTPPGVEYWIHLWGLGYCNSPVTVTSTRLKPHLERISFIALCAAK